MPSDLERIEEKHRESPVRGADGTGYCYEDDLPYPCDVVKLARALECVLDSEGGCECEGPSGDCPWCRGWRTLREVADE